MKNLMRNKKGIAPVLIIGVVIFSVLVLGYIIGKIFFPSLVATFFYWIMIILFVFVQGLFIYGYYQLGKLAFKGLQIYQKRILKTILNIERLVV